MVYWITKLIGTRAVGEELKDEEYGSIIVDVRNLVDGKNDIVPLMNAVKLLMGLCTYCSQTNRKLIIQCQAGISRSNALAAVLIALQVNIELDEALEFVKKKCPRTNINQDLLDQIKKGI